MEHFFRLYGRRSRIFLPGLRDRIDFLNIAIGDLQEAIRKEFPAPTLGVELARIVSRIFAVVEHFRGLPLIDVLSRKYPEANCSYCQQHPCACVERRSPAQLAAAVSAEQFTWSLRDWQRHLAALYGKRNQQTRSGERSE